MGILLFAVLLALATPSLAQCGCRDLHLAMTGSRQYQYRYYQVGGRNTTTVAPLSIDYDQQLPSAHTQKSPPRPQVWINLPLISAKGFQVEVLDVVAQQHMLLTFRYPAADALTYTLLFDFAAGRHYQVALDESGPLPGFDVTVAEPSDDRGNHWLLLHQK